ncbi:MAG: DsbA family protein [Bdellovibrionales bacterium]|nr:DsbA family protein [Bdellovibrionales bacterium]
MNSKATVLSLVGIAVLSAALAACTEGSAKVKPNLVYKAAPSADVVAKINGQTITMEDLVGDEKVAYFDLEKKLFEFKMARLKAVMVDRLVGSEAKGKSMSTAEYVEKHVTKGKLKVSDKEYNDFVKEKRIPESSINPSLKERIMAYLEENKREEVVDAYVAKITKSNPVEVYFTKPKMDIKVEIGNAPTMGGDKAPVTIVEFSDFQCPFCSRGATTMHEVAKKYGSKVKIAFKHFPLPMHREAKPASEASMCVNEQDSKKFWKFHDLVFENQKALDDASLEKYAQQVGADMKKFKECYGSKKYAKTVDEDMAYGEKLGVRSTPTFFVNGELVSGAVPIEQFSEVIDSVLEDS